MEDREAQRRLLASVTVLRRERAVLEAIRAELPTSPEQDAMFDSVAPYDVTTAVWAAIEVGMNEELDTLIRRL